MLIYKNSNGNSNVESYEIGNEYIDVWFKGSKKVYRYSVSAWYSYVRAKTSLALIDRCKRFTSF